jgi:malonyl-CoA/methylmalonyl-CoA synthetase
MDAMLSAWRLTKNDTILNVLPLHHVHGMINCVMSPLYAGGTVVMMNKFDAEQVLKLIILFFIIEYLLDMESST